MADQQAAGANLWPPGFNVCFDGFVAVLAVDEDEVQFSVLEAAGGFGRRQADRMPAAGVDGEVAQRDRQAPVERLGVAELLNVVWSGLLGVCRVLRPWIDSIELKVGHQRRQVGGGDSMEDADFDPFGILIRQISRPSRHPKPTGLLTRSSFETRERESSWRSRLVSRGSGVAELRR